MNETPVVNLMGNGFGHISSDYPAPSNVINNYMPVRRQNRLRGLDGKEVRVEEKSPEIFMELIKRFSQKGDLVADFFAGSGASGEAAMRVNRNWIGCDVDPIVFPACRQRLLNYFSSNIRLGLISPSGTVSNRLVPIGADRFKQLEQTMLQGPDYWLNTPPHIDLSRSDSILDQDKTANDDLCYVAE